MAPGGPAGKAVLVTGANGFLGSHIVKQLLAKGYDVHGAVRDTSAPRVGHLSSLAGATERLRLFGVGDLTTASFDEAVRGCSGVIHAATPLGPKFTGDFDGERDIYKPALASTEELLRCIERHADAVECLVLTSSMSAMAPSPEPAPKDESHWSDSSRQKSRQNWYGAAKTDQERLCHDVVEQAKAKGSLRSGFRFAAICPTMIVGEVLGGGTEVSGTMGSLHGWFRGSKAVAPNDSMSFIHVEDCAAQHVAALERGEGRYMSLVESWHWDDIAVLLNELNPSGTAIKPYEGSDKVRPTQFNLDRMRSLGVEVRPVRQAVEESFQYLKRVGAL